MLIVNHQLIEIGSLRLRYLLQFYLLVLLLLYLFHAFNTFKKTLPQQEQRSLATGLRDLISSNSSGRLLVKIVICYLATTLSWCQIVTIKLRYFMPCSGTFAAICLSDFLLGCIFKCINHNRSTRRLPRPCPNFLHVTNIL